MLPWLRQVGDPASRAPCTDIPRVWRMMDDASLLSLAVSSSNIRLDPEGMRMCP